MTPKKPTELHLVSDEGSESAELVYESGVVGVLTDRDRPPDWYVLAFRCWAEMQRRERYDTEEP